MDKIVTVAEMKAIEAEADRTGLTYAEMMKNAGIALAECVKAAYSRNTNRSIMALIGSGNNGGDALVAVAYLANLGWRASGYLVRPRPSTDPLIAGVVQEGGEIFSTENDRDFLILSHLLDTHQVLIDGVLGTGVKLPLQSDISVCLKYVKDFTETKPHALRIVSVDCPSGIDCDNGQVAPETIPSDITVTMAAVKRGLLSLPAADLTGTLQVVSIGKLDDLNAWRAIRCWVVDEHWVRRVMPLRPRNAHKGTFGTALIVAGSTSYTGAAYLAGMAAYRSGAGLVQMAVPFPLHQVLAGQMPEAIWLLLPMENGNIAAGAADLLVDDLKTTSALLVGPGFGLETTTKNFVQRLFTEQEMNDRFPPLVVDADGLKLLASIPEWYKKLPPSSILTPHPGEMAILSGLSIQQIQADRIGTAQKFASLWNQVVVLKGAFSVVASPTGDTVVNPIATPALARAGSGDVLAGLIVGLLAQGLCPYEAAVSAVWIHAQAGLLAEKQMGAASTLAGDLLRTIVDIIRDLGEKKLNEK